MVGARAVVQTFVPGGVLLESAEKLAELLSDALWSQMSAWPQDDQRQAFDELATLQPGAAQQIASDAVRSVRADDAARAALENHIASVPTAVRRGLQVCGIQSTVATRLSQLPRNAAEVRKFVPLRPPLYAAGKKLEGTNYRLRQLLGQGGPSSWLFIDDARAMRTQKKICAEVYRLDPSNRSGPARADEFAISLAYISPAEMRCCPSKSINQSIPKEYSPSGTTRKNSTLLPANPRR